jgi:histidyl-tRNA synthetase
MMVRGLDYYTRTAFEFVSTSTELGSQDSLGGGGRYDNLVEDFGGPKTPAIGFALGLERILLAMGNHQPIRKLVYIITLDADTQKKGKDLLTLLRNANIPALLNQPDKNLRAGLGIADNLASEYVIIIGSNEMKNNVYTVKNLVKRTQEQVAQDQVVTFLTNK